MTESPKPPQVGAGEVADLLAWARSLSEHGPHTDPHQRVAFFAAKAELLARITDNPHIAAEDGDL